MGRSIADGLIAVIRWPIALAVCREGIRPSGSNTEIRRKDRQKEKEGKLGAGAPFQEGDQAHSSLPSCLQSSDSAALGARLAMTPSFTRSAPTPLHLSAQSLIHWPSPQS